MEETYNPNFKSIEFDRFKISKQRISLYFIKNRLQLKLDLLRAVWELMPLYA